MRHARRSSAITLVLLSLGFLQPVEAQAFELSGAWASQPDLCKLVFTKKTNQVVFAELSDLYGSGFIVDGSRIRGIRMSNGSIRTSSGAHFSSGRNP